MIYVGGNIALGKQPWPEVEQRFHDMGIDRVFPPRTQPQKAIELLKQDLLNSIVEKDD
jgi:methylaspartate mutase sigma subunit